MQAFKWEPADTNASTGSASLEPGGYVLKITGVEDNEHVSSPYLAITYDIAEGEHMGHYSDEWGQQHEWAHQMRWYYTEKSMWRFNKNLTALAETNPGFDPQAFAAAPDPRKLIGLLVGGLIQKRYYTNGYGEDKEALEVADVVSAAAIRANDFTMPEPRDNRAKTTPTPVASTASIDDLPF